MPPFDPYRDWLGIEPQESAGGRIDHYRLLGLALFEDDAERIARAADERMALVRSFQVGRRRIHTQKLLNELSAARICLLSPAAKAAYDADLRRAGLPLAPPLASPPIVEPPVQASPPPARPMPTDDEAFAEPNEPAPWWRPIVTMLLAALAVLAAAVAWGIVQQTRRHAEPIASPAAPLQPQPEPPPPEPIVQLQEANGDVHFAPAAAILGSGVQLRTSGTGELLAGIGSSDSQVQWKFRLVEPGFFHVELTYATATDAEAAVLEAVLDDESKRCDLRSTGGEDQFLTDTFTFAIPKGGEHTLILRPERPPAGPWLVLKSVRLVPISRPPPPVLTP